MDANSPTHPGNPATPPPHPDWATAAAEDADPFADWVPGPHDLIPLLPRGKALFEAIPARAIVVEALSPAIGNGAVIARQPGCVGVILVKDGSIYEQYAFQDGTRIDGEAALRAIRDWDDAAVSAFQFDPIVVAVAPSLFRGTPCYEDLRLEWTNWRGLLADLCRRHGLYVVELDTPVGRGVTLIVNGRQVAAYTEIHPEIGDERLLDPLAATGRGTIWVRREPPGWEGITLDLGTPDPAPEEVAVEAEDAAEAAEEPEVSSPAEEHEVLAEAGDQGPAESVPEPEGEDVEAIPVPEPDGAEAMPAPEAEGAEAASAPEAEGAEAVSAPEEEEIEIDWSALPPWRGEGVAEAGAGEAAPAPYAEGASEVEPAAYATGATGSSDPFAAFRNPMAAPPAEPEDPFAVFRSPAEAPPTVPVWDAYADAQVPTFQLGAPLPLAAVATDLKHVARLRLQRSSPRVEAMVDEAAARDLPLDALLDEIRGLVIRGVMQSTLDELVEEMAALAMQPPD